MKNLFLRNASVVLLLAGMALAGCSKKPDACFTIEKGQPSSKINDEVEVSAACSTDADQYVWDFGDGFSTTGAKAKHKYNAVGQFTLKLTAKNDSKESTTSKQVTIVP
ncbi:PKD domain-containing protein [Hymenobacter sp. B1770]|uniref:PKD domain-containing protein n=1 Tax=Hymenobacter sp. B1770 TaxID=1718788 RepID=UPI003CECD4AF